MHRRLLTCDELHRSQVDSLSQARHQGNVSQRPKRHHLTAEKPYRGIFTRGKVSSLSVDVVTVQFPLRIRNISSVRANQSLRCHLLNESQPSFSSMPVRVSHLWLSFFFI